MIDVPATIHELSGLAPLVTAVGVILVGFWAYRGKQQASRAAKAAEDNKAQLVEIDGKVYRLGERLDGTLSKLLDAKDEKAAAQVEAARATGVATGEQQQRDRAGPPQP